MLWKSVSGLIVVFWIVMTAILVKHSYFPDEGATKSVPVSVVLGRVALRQTQSGGSETMQLLHERDAVGDVSLGIARRPNSADGKPAGFTLKAGGRITGKAFGTDAATAASWTFEADQSDAQSFQRVRLAVNSTQTKTNITVEWKLGDEMPKIEVLRDDKLIMDTKGVLEEAKKQGTGSIGMPGLGMMMPGLFGSQKLSLEHLIQMQAREEMIKVGDRKVRGTTLTMSALGLLQSKLRVTEGGEIAELELPNHWRALALMVLGMEPEVRTK